LSDLSSTDCIVQWTRKAQDQDHRRSGGHRGPAHNAEYYTIEDLKADYLVDMVKGKIDG